MSTFFPVHLLNVTVTVLFSKRQILGRLWRPLAGERRCFLVFAGLSSESGWRAVESQCVPRYACNGPWASFISHICYWKGGVAVSVNAMNVGVTRETCYCCSGNEFFVQGLHRPGCPLCKLRCVCMAFSHYTHVRVVDECRVDWRSRLPLAHSSCHPPSLRLPSWGTAARPTLTPSINNSYNLSCQKWNTSIIESTPPTKKKDLSKVVSLKGSHSIFCGRWNL